MRTHAARFEQSTPVAVRTTSIARRRLRELVATVDLPVPPLLTCPPMLQPCHAHGLRAPASVPEAQGSSCGLTPLAPGLTRCHALWPQAAPHTPWPGPHRPTLAWRSTRSRWWPTRRSTTTRTRWPSTGLRGRVASARLCRASRVYRPRPASHARSQAGLETGGQVAWPLSPLPRWRQRPECPPAAFLERNPRAQPGLSRSPPSSQRAPASPPEASLASGGLGRSEASGAPCSPYQSSRAQRGFAKNRLENRRENRLEYRLEKCAADSGAPRVQGTGTSVVCPRSQCSRTSPTREARPTASSTSRRWGGGRVSVRYGAATCGQSPTCGAARR